jgi:hypothetical protein
MKGKGKFFSFLSFLLLILACIAATAALVFPLWKFATAAPKIYTITILSLCLISIIFLIVRKCMKKGKKR